MQQTQFYQSTHMASRCTGLRNQKALWVLNSLRHQRVQKSQWAQNSQRALKSQRAQNSQWPQKAQNSQRAQKAQNSQRAQWPQNSQRRHKQNQAGHRDHTFYYNGGTQFQPV